MQIEASYPAETHLLALHRFGHRPVCGSTERARAISLCMLRKVPRNAEN